MHRVWVSAIVLYAYMLSGVVWAKPPSDVLRALNKARFKGSAFLSSQPKYSLLLKKTNKRKARQPFAIEGIPLRQERDRLSAGREYGQFESEGLYDLHQLLIGRKGDRILLGIVDGLWGDTYLGGFVAEKVTSLLHDALTRQALPDALLSLPEQIEYPVDRQVRGIKESPHPGDYDRYAIIAEDAGAFALVAEISKGKLHVAHIGNARLLVIRDGEVIWQTQAHNPDYRMSSNHEAVINPDDEGEGNIFKAIELPDNMGATMDELLESSAIKLEQGDRIILASNSVWQACTQADILNWTKGLANAEANRNARERLAQRIARLNEISNEEYDPQFSLIIYDYEVN